MGLHNLIHDGQSQACTAFKLRLERLKDFLSKVWGNARAGIANTDAQKIACCPHRNSDRPFALHGAHSVFQQVPQHLLDSVGINGGIRLAARRNPAR